LSGLLGTPIAGADAAAFDNLSNQYVGATQQGMSDIASRGLTQSGAVPQLFTNAGEQYATGAGQAVAAGQQQQNQQSLQILNSLLGLGSTAAGTTEAGLGTLESGIGTGVEAATGLFGNAPNTLFGPGGGGLISKGLGGIFGSGGLLSQLLGP